MASEEGHGISSKDLVTRHRVTREGFRYIIVYPPPSIRSMQPVRSTAPAPGWREIRVEKDLPHQLQEDRNLLGLVEFLAYEINSSPARFVYGGDVGTRKRLQMLLRQEPQPTSVSNEHMPNQTSEPPAHQRLCRRGIPIDAALDSALAGLNKTHDRSAAYGQEPCQHLPPQDHARCLDAPLGNSGEQGEADWIMVNNSQSTKEVAPYVHRSTGAQDDVIRGLAALVALLTGKLPEQEDIVYETTLTEHGYRTRITLSCIDSNIIQGAPFSGRQDAVLSAAERAIELLTDNCNFRMSPALDPQKELSRGSSS
jgi:hypothetical protein